MSKKILFIDDDREFIHSLALRCTQRGYHAETASNSLTAIHSIDNNRPDLICLDVDMPSGNGLRVCEFLQNDANCGDIPVIVITGHKDEATIRACEEMNARYLHKSPDLWDRLSAVLTDVLEPATALANS